MEIFGYSANLSLLATGGVLFLIGLLFNNWAGRYDFRGMLISSSWHLLRGRWSKERPTEVEERLKEINEAPTNLGKAKRLSGNIIGHFLAPIVGFIGLVLLLGGLGFIGASFWIG